MALIEDDHFEVDANGEMLKILIPNNDDRGNVQIEPAVALLHLRRGADNVDARAGNEEPFRKLLCPIVAQAAGAHDEDRPLRVVALRGANRLHCLPKAHLVCDHCATIVLEDIRNTFLLKRLQLPKEWVGVGRHVWVGERGCRRCCSRLGPVGNCIAGGRNEPITRNRRRQFWVAATVRAQRPPLLLRVQFLFHEVATSVGTLDKVKNVAGHLIHSVGRLKGLHRSEHLLVVCNWKQPLLPPRAEEHAGPSVRVVKEGL